MAFLGALRQWPLIGGIGGTGEGMTDDKLRPYQRQFIDRVVRVPRGEGLSETTTGRIANREPEVQYLKIGQDGETVTYYYAEAEELPGDDLLDAMVRGVDLLTYRDVDYSSVEDRMAAYWLDLSDRRIPKLNPSEVFTKEYGTAVRTGRDNGHFNKAVAKRRARNKAARKARAKAR